VLMTLSMNAKSFETNKGKSQMKITEILIILMNRWRISFDLTNDRYLEVDVQRSIAEYHVN
jgi:hypothetical protein